MLRNRHTISIGGWVLGKTAKFGFSLICSALIISCQSPDKSVSGDRKPGQPKVIVTNTIIGDLTAKVAADKVNLVSLLKPGDDPHLYEPTPQDSRALESAQLVLYNGYNLEPGIIRMMESTSGQAKRVAVGEVVKPLSLSENGKTVPDPHVWGDVKNAIFMVGKIRDELAGVSPENKALFTQNAEQLIAELKKLDNAIAQQIQTIPPQNRRLVTTHDAFQYYGKAYGIEILGTLIGVSTEEQPSAQTVKNLVTTIQKSRVPTIFAETTLNPDLIKTVAKEANVKLATTPLYSDSIDVKGSRGDSYIKMMQENTKTIVEGLRR